MAAPYLYKMSYENNKAYRYAGFSSTVDASFTITNAVGISWNGTDTYWSPNGSTSLKKGTGFGATVQSSITLGAAATDIQWKTKDGAGNFIAVFDSSAVKQYTGFSTTVSSSFTLGSNQRCVSWDGTNVLLSHAGTVKIYKQSGFSSTVSASFTTTPTSGTSPRGIAWDDTNVLVAWDRTALTQRVCKYSGFSSTITDSFSAPTGDTDGYGMDWLSGSASGPANMKSYNTNVKANIKSINTNVIANVKSFDTNA